MMHKRKIALIEDNHQFRKILADLVDLYTTDFTVVLSASNGLDLLEKMETLKPIEYPDIIMTDFDMPVMNGYETANHIEKNYPTIKVIAISLRGDESSIIKMIANGAAGYLQKTLEPDELPFALHAVINDQYYISRHRSQRLQGVSLSNFLVKLPSEFQIYTIWNTMDDNERKMISLLCSPIEDAEIARSAKIPLYKVEYFKKDYFQRFQVPDRITLALLSKKYNLLQHSYCS
jgi:two-component system, NarL family, invasion response regulator UvrY